MTKKELMDKIEIIIKEQREKDLQEFKKFKELFAQKRIEAGVGYNKETGNLKSYTTLLKPQLEAYLQLLEETAGELNIEEVKEETAEAFAEELNVKCGKITGEEALASYDFKGNQWGLLDHVEKCKRAVEIIQEDYAVGMSQEDIQDIYNKGAELYGKAFTDAVPQEILEYIQGGTVIYKGVNGNLEELKVDLNDLEQLQELVGGNIQTVELPCNIIMVVNESGWVDNLPMNFRLNNLAIFGNVFFCSHNDADFVGLSARQKRFIKEEIFKQIDVRLV